MASDGTSVWSNNFDYLRFKIGRAYKHLKEFDAAYVKFCGSNPYTITKQDDLVNQRHIVRCDFHPVDFDIVLALSDAVYSLRSGLDQLAWHLALLGNASPSKEVMFPIVPDNTAKSQERIRKLTGDMPSDAIKIIKDLQPYNRGNAFRDDPLWQLERTQQCRQT